MAVIEIKLDKTSLPTHRQKVKWQTYTDINNGTWKQGVFDAKEQLFLVGFKKTYSKWDLAYDVHQWEKI